MEQQRRRTQVPLVCHGHSRPIVDLAYSPVTDDGYFLISASKAMASVLCRRFGSRSDTDGQPTTRLGPGILHGKPMLRNGETGDWIGTFEGHKGAVWGACLDTPALRAATASADFSAAAAIAVHCCGELSTSPASFLPPSLPLSSFPPLDPSPPDGMSVGALRRVWDALSGDELHLFEHKHIVRTIAFSQDSRLLLTGGHERMLRVFDLNAPEAPPSTIEGLAGPVRCVTWHADDHLILSSLSDLGGHSAAIPPALPPLLEPLRIWQIPSHWREGSCWRPALTAVLHVAAAHSIWDVRTKAVVASLATGSPCTSVEVSRDGRFITTADNFDVKFWDANSFELVKSYQLAVPVESASLYPAIGKFVAGGADMWIRIFDFETGEELECHKGHHGPVHCVRFAPGGESYSSGSEDGTIRIWRAQVDDADATPALAGHPPVAASAINNGSDEGFPALRVSANEVAQKVEGFHVSEGVNGSAN
eukprot:SM000309S11874  [mRNA]  locus=s309:126579:128660:- [translate_table: standard]